MTRGGHAARPVVPTVDGAALNRCGHSAAEAFVRRGVPLEGYVREIETLYGRGEPGWLGRQLDRLPAGLARLAVRAVLALGLARRRIVFDGIFGMQEAQS